MTTAFLLIAQYNSAAIVPLEVVCKDYFSHLTPVEFVRKATNGQIDWPVVRIEGSQKAAKGVHLIDLAKWIDDRRAAAQKSLISYRGDADATSPLTTGSPAKRRALCRQR